MTAGVTDASPPEGATSPEWDAIVRAHDRRVLLLLLAMGLRFDRARELAQATWLRLWEQHQGGKLPRLEFPGLALQQARFLGLDELRRQRAHDGIERTFLEVEAPTADPERIVIGRQELALVQRALAECPPSSQRLFRLLYEQPALSHAEAAARLGLSVQRVRQVLCEVRKKLRAALEPQRGEP